MDMAHMLRWWLALTGATNVADPSAAVRLPDAWQAFWQAASTLSTRAKEIV